MIRRMHRWFASPKRLAEMHRAHVVPVRNINIAAADKEQEKNKGGDFVVELDNIRIELSSFEKPLLEVRDSL